MSDMDTSMLPVDKSFMTNVTEDEDTKMMDATPEPSEKPRGRRPPRDSMAANGGSLIGKVKHLKKEDGEPLWRKDIQYDFLKAVFDDEQQVFTNSYEPQTIGKQCFADLYIDTMARSSKTSKVLRDKLLSDRAAAKGMAMVCLLVNIGRMNTTLNCEYIYAKSTSFISIRMLITSKSSPRCEPSYEHTTRFLLCRRAKTLMPTSSYKMLRV